MKVKYSVVATSGFTSLIVSLYVMGRDKKQGFEWLSYKLEKSISGDFYTDEWISAIDDFIVDNFDKVKKSEINNVLVFKLNDTETGESIYDSTTNLRTVLQQSIRPYFVTDKKRMVNFQNEIFSTKNLLKYGVDKIFWIDVKTSNSDLKLKSDRIAEAYTWINSKSHEDKAMADIVFELKSDFNVSSVGNLGKKIKFGYNKAKDWIKENKERLK
jgi:hypothetical protein